MRAMVRRTTRVRRRVSIGEVGVRACAREVRILVVWVGEGEGAGGEGERRYFPAARMQDVWMNGCWGGGVSVGMLGDWGK